MAKGLGMPETMESLVSQGQRDRCRIRRFMMLAVQRPAYVQIISASRVVIPTRELHTI